PLSTDGCVDSSTSSGSARGSTPVSSRTLWEIASIELVHALDQRAEVGERCNDHVDGQQVTGAIQALQRRAVQIQQAFFLEGVEAGEPILRAIVQLDVEHERFQQVMLQ